MGKYELKWVTNANGSQSRVMHEHGVPITPPAKSAPKSTPKGKK